MRLGCHVGEFLINYVLEQFIIIMVRWLSKDNIAGFEVDKIVGGTEEVING